MSTETSPDFIASINYLTADKGGLKTPLSSGFRCRIAFDYIDKQGICEQVFEHQEWIFPGDTVEATVKLSDTDLFANKLGAGTSFELQLNENTVGTGVILQLLNDELVKK
ncbi:hypothetical protein QQ054_23175 [Oscillatoria amoena NRMC-F 0135]|nr:MAG: hypothetical protein F9K23_10790 [Bacteroidota bacterium]MDL5048918.1 hypothetical protein [Oscillatoria amoena NRMC-F 0135]